MQPKTRIKQLASPNNLINKKEKKKPIIYTHKQRHAMHR